MIENGKNVTIDYKLSIHIEGELTEIDHGDMTYTHGENTLIPGLEKALEGLAIDDQKDIIIAPEDGFGSYDPEAKESFDRSEFPEDEEIYITQNLEMESEDGELFMVTVADIKDNQVIIDMNHPLAGKDLHFSIKVTSID